MIRVYTKEELKAKCPAAFNEVPHPRTSDKYALIQTESIVDAISSHNMAIVGVHARQDETGSHLIEFQSNETLDKPEVGGVAYRVGLWNAHNGLKPFVLLAQVYRYVCSNGLKVGITAFPELRIIHRGNPERIRQCIEAAVKDVLTRGDAVMRQVAMLQSIQLGTIEQRVLAKRAIDARWPNIDNQDVIAYGEKVELALQSRRPEDTQNDAWSVFNRIQENIIRGYGMRSFQAVRSVNTDVDLNRKLWDNAIRLSQGQM